MANQFRDKWILRYYADKPYNELLVWNLGVIDIPNPKSEAHRRDVINVWNEYEKIRDDQGKSDGSLIFGNGCEWMVVEAGNIEGVLLKFEEARKRRG